MTGAETCRCGASITVESGASGWVTLQLDKFRDAHDVCRTRPSGDSAVHDEIGTEAWLRPTQRPRGTSTERSNG